MRRILVTGGAGFIGQAVAAELAGRGDQVVTFDRPKSILRKGHLDIAFWNVAGVINLAGVLGTEETLGAEKHAAEVNILGALNVFDVAADRGVPVVQIGTGHKGQPNPYAITKGCAEDLGLARARYRGEHIVVVRAFHAYGPGQKVCPPHGTASVRKIVPSFVCRALTGMPIEINGSGEQLIDLVHVDDVARVLVDALDVPAGSVLEAGTGKPTSVVDAAKDVAAVVGQPVELVFRPMRPGEPEDSTVVAASPACHNPWPHRLDETVDYYRRLIS